MKSATAFIVAVLGGLIFLVTGTVGWSVGRGAVAGVASGQSAPPLGSAHLYVTIATPAMLGTEFGPAFLPSALTVPANAEITVTVVNFDGATPLAGWAIQYAKAAGIAGKLTCQPLDATNPNASAKSPAKGVTSLDPSVVTHTLTIPKLNLNVPICADGTTTFTFYSGAAGKYAWRCMDPCGPGTDGWGGAMSSRGNGYMSGLLTVV